MNLPIYNKKEEIKKLILELDELARKDSDNVEINIGVEYKDESSMFGKPKNVLSFIDISVRIDI